MRRAASLLLLAAATAAVVLAGGSGCSDTRMERFTGQWERLRGGVEDPRAVLSIEGEGTQAVVTFEDTALGTRSSAAAELEGGALSLALPGDGGGADLRSARPSPAASETASDAVPVQLTVDPDADVLSVRMVAPGGQLVPLWTYARRGDPH